MRRELLLGCGNSREKRLGEWSGWRNLVTLDIDPACKPNVVHELGTTALPFRDNMFDEIHAYEVLEHYGKQGDWRGFFADFYDLWRVLKPFGILYGTSPDWRGEWLWGDPGHARVISAGAFTFLSQKEYSAQVGVTPMTDYRGVWRGDFRALFLDVRGDTFFFGLQAIK